MIQSVSSSKLTSSRVNSGSRSGCRKGGVGERRLSTWLWTSGFPLRDKSPCHDLPLCCLLVTFGSGEVLGLIDGELVEEVIGLLYLVFAASVSMALVLVPGFVTEIWEIGDSVLGAWSPAARLVCTESSTESLVDFGSGSRTGADEAHFAGVFDPVKSRFQSTEGG